MMKLMTAFYRHFVKPILFQSDPEMAHDWTLRILHSLSRNARLLATLDTFYQASPLPIQVEGLHFPNPVGLAAGMDKNAKALPAWPSLGFGFVELGGVTYHAQPGNPKPRMFRLPSDLGVINRMGFNNNGALATVQQLEEWKKTGGWPKVPVALNLGKSKITPLESAPEEYAKLVHCFWRWADFFIVNVSSPNTPELRKLQGAQAIDHVLSAIDEEVTACRAAHPTLPTRPIWVKVDPDLSNPELDALMEVCGRHPVQGIVATNTTTWRPQHPSDSTYSQTGGLSGAPLRERSSEVIRWIHQRSQGKLKIIGVGGIMTARDAWEKIGAGACLLQVYSGLVFKGPTLVKELVAGLSNQVCLHGLKSLDQAVGKGLPFLAEED